MTQAERTSTELWPLLLLVAAYVLSASLYAWQTPLWQAPDEPAHYNYLTSLANTGKVPVLEPGDYPAKYLEEIKAKKFPPGMSVAPIRYEFHQPPLYYTLAALVYKVVARRDLSTQVLVLRLLSVLFGAGVVVFAYFIALTLFADKPVLALATATIVATVPMHVAMTAAINNDTMAEFLIAAALWLLIRPVTRDSLLRTRLATGLVLGLGLFTKVTVAAVVLAVPVALWMGKGENRAGQGTRAGFLSGVFGSLVVVWGVAGAIVSPWLVRNALVYEQKDVFGLLRHNAVVVGQPRTSEWLTLYGNFGYARRFLVTTFHSFWGQFGWMGVPMSARVYDILFIFMVLAALGFFLYFKDVWLGRGANRSPLRAKGLATLGFTLLATVLAYVGYNVTFVQFQGRYLFPALIPIGLFLALGLQDVISLHRWRLMVAILIVGMFSLDVYSLYGFILPQLR